MRLPSHRLRPSDRARRGRCAPTRLPRTASGPAIAPPRSGASPDTTTLALPPAQRSRSPGAMRPDTATPALLLDSAIAPLRSGASPDETTLALPPAQRSRSPGAMHPDTATPHCLRPSDCTRPGRHSPTRPLLAASGPGNSANRPGAVLLLTRLDPHCLPSSGHARRDRHFCSQLPTTIQPDDMTN